MQSEQRGAKKKKKKKDLEWWGDDGGAGSAPWDFRDAESLGDFFQALGGEQRGWREWLCWEFLLAWAPGSSLLAGCGSSDPPGQGKLEDHILPRSCGVV